MQLRWPVNTPIETGKFDVLFVAVQKCQVWRKWQKFDRVNVHKFHISCGNVCYSVAILFPLLKIRSLVVIMRAACHII